MRQYVENRNRYYVYMWYEPGANLPVYIGKGYGSRAYRDESRGLDVRIVIEGLNNDDANRIERVLLIEYDSLGAPLRNKRIDDPCSSTLWGSEEHALREMGYSNTAMHGHGV